MDLLQKKGELVDRQRTIINAAKTELRELTEAEATEFENLDGQIKTIDNLLAKDAAVAARETAMDKPAAQAYRPTYAGPGAPSQSNQAMDDAGFKSLGEFINAVRFGDKHGRLNSLDRSDSGGIRVPEKFRAQIMPLRNEWTMGTGAEGGFAVPEQRSNNVLMIGAEGGIIRPLATVIEPGDPPDAKITFPAFAQGSNGVFGGVTVEWIGEGGTKPETSGKLREIALEPKEVAAHTVVTDKLLRNWVAANSFISGILRSAIDAAEDYSFLRGDGVGKPVGILNTPGALAVNRATANTVKYVDVVNMLAKLLPESQTSALWVANQSILPQLMTLKDDANNLIFIKGDATRGIPNTLAGIPIRFTGRTPVLGSKGDLMLVDARYYLIKDGSGPFVAASEHVLFKENKTVIKVFWNVDGNGWVDQALKLEDGSTTVSPYVVLDVPAA